MSKNDGGAGGAGLISPELALIGWPWNLNGVAHGDRFSVLSSTPGEQEEAMRSLVGLLHFKERHVVDVDAAYAKFPGLKDVFWGPWNNELNALMPTMGDITWRRLGEWAESADPAWLDEDWERPPEGFVRAVAWVWSDNNARESSQAIIEWFIGQFGENKEHPRMLEFLEVLTTYVPRTGKFGEVLVAILSRAAQEKAIPYYARLVEEEGMPVKLKEIAEKYYEWLTVERNN